jgi:hypothetical protein
MGGDTNVMPRRLIARGRRPLGLLLGTWLFALVVETAPHLAHHLFDEDPASACEFLAAADHDPVIVGAPAVVLGALPARDEAIDRSQPSHPTPAAPAAVSRAPPLCVPGLSLTS